MQYISKEEKKQCIIAGALAACIGISAGLSIAYTSLGNFLDSPSERLTERPRVCSEKDMRVRVHWEGICQDTGGTLPECMKLSEELFCPLEGE